MLPAAILCAVVLVQRWQVAAHGLTPWMGAGFSMFTSLDGAYSRHLRCTALDASGHELGTWQRTAALSVLTRPAGSALEHAAAELAARRCDAPPELALQTAAVRVEVWSSGFEPESATVRAYPVAGLTRELP